ncbi:MAG: glycolate oxidase subunit GlcF [Acidobacteria bacterium]|nr:glycolate oxidase subunit GlcF [Acidobacteriota bacterium]
MAATSGAFDAHHPPSTDLLADCVHCGFCLPPCPTYALWSRETDSPRGRIHLMKVATEGKAAITPEVARHFDTCLGCMACVTACPSGVQYDKLIEAARPQIERHVERPFGDRLFRRLIFSLFPYPGRLRWIALKLWAYQRLGIQRVVRASGLLGLLPARLRAMEAVAPRISLGGAWSSMPAVVPADGERRRRVALLLGCVQRVFFSDVNRATARVLAAEGCEVMIPQAQGCCGALMLHSGLEDDAAAMARRFIDAFEPALAEADAIVINAAGCGSTLKEYGHLLRDDAAYAERAAALAAKCRDISEVLAELEPRAPRHPVPLRVAYHDACHLQHAQGVRAEPRRVLATIPELDVQEVPEGGLCCGSAGIYNLVEPDAASELGRRKARNVAATDAEAVVSSNPGCLLQLASTMEGEGRPLPTMHLVEIVDASIRGRRTP